jgi:hypothetical protein
MKLAVLSAVLLGLSSQGEAARVGKAVEFPAASLETALTGSDLDFDLQSVNDTLLDLDEEQPELIATAIDSANIDFTNIDFDLVDVSDDGLTASDNAAVVPEALLVDRQQSPGLRRVPEPPPAALAAIGLGFLGFFALGRRIREKKRGTRRRRVLVQMREIIAER